ncbi:MAG: hypothetical protein ACLUE2_15845 [Bacteroides cellulosilyticus]
MFLTYKKDLEERPVRIRCILYGYGGFNIGLNPGFSASTVFRSWKMEVSMHKLICVVVASMVKTGT